jgi:hypothetical protein
MTDIEIELRPDTAWTVWKYPLFDLDKRGQLVVADRVEIEMPAGAQVLTVQMQPMPQLRPNHEHPWIWALVSPNNTPNKRIFRVIGTGHPIKEVVPPSSKPYEMRLPQRLRYVGTIQLSGGELVFHIFEEINESLPC